MIAASPESAGIDPAVAETVEASWPAIVDLRIEQKVEALEQLRAWVGLQETSWSPEVIATAASHRLHVRLPKLKAAPGRPPA
jgi:hypothetical protein